MCLSADLPRRTNNVAGIKMWFHRRQELLMLILMMAAVWQLQLLGSSLHLALIRHLTQHFSLLSSPLSFSCMLKRDKDILPDVSLLWRPWQGFRGFILSSYISWAEKKNNVADRSFMGFEHPELIILAQQITFLFFPEVSSLPQLQIVTFYGNPHPLIVGVFLSVSPQFLLVFLFPSNTMSPMKPGMGMW